jgi:hypothetical protein
MARGDRYTDEQISFLREIEGISIYEMTRMFNEKFNVNFSKEGVRKKCDRVGIKYIGKYHDYTYEQVSWLRNHRQHTIEEMTMMFNERFNVSLSKASIAKACLHREIYSENKRWTASNHPSRESAIGHERIKDGYLYVKVASPNKWRWKHLIVYEKNYGPIPEGYKVFFKDQNTLNCDPENLTLVTNAELARLSKIQYKKQHDEIKPVLLTLVRLNQAIQDRSK